MNTPQEMADATLMDMMMDLTVLGDEAGEKALTRLRELARAVAEQTWEEAVAGVMLDLNSGSYTPNPYRLPDPNGGDTE